MRYRPIVVGISMVAVLAAVSRAADWTQWRGPERTGVSAETGLAHAWPAGGPKLLWQVRDLGEGYGSVAIVGGHVYLLGNDGLDNEFVEARSAADGRRIWRRRIGNVGEPDQSPNYPAARSTPTIDGDRLYALGSDGDLVCLNAMSGDLLWQKNLRADFHGQPSDWGYAESPLVDGKVLICTPGGIEAGLAALDKTNGEVLWKCENPTGEAAGYASALAVELNGRKQYVQYLSQGLVGVDAATGKYLWRALDTERDNMATPIEFDGYVYVPAFLSGGGLVRLESTSGGVAAQQVYRKRGLPCQIGGAVLVGGFLYGTVQDGLVCADFKTGEVKWQAPSIGPGAVCSADGLIILHGENSQLALVAATPTAYHEQGRFTLPEPPLRKDQMEQAWAYPAVANGRLYVRDKNVLWCYDIAEAKPAGGR